MRAPARSGRDPVACPKLPGRHGPAPPEAIDRSPDAKKARGMPLLRRGATAPSPTPTRLHATDQGPDPQEGKDRMR
jgi:hypothetical protein